jgi:DNA-binding transcriptional ArsR family regulator
MIINIPMNRSRREQAARVLQALAHPLRLQILQELKGGEETAARLLARLGCSQSMLSQQMKILEHQGLIESRKEGTCKVCRIRNPKILSLFDCLQHHLGITARRGA